MPKSRATEDAKVGNIERPFSGEDGLSGADTAGEGDSLRCSPKTTTGGGDEDDTEKAERSRRKRGSTPTSDLGTPKKLLELIEDRDRAVHLCLQVCAGRGGEVNALLYVKPHEENILGLDTAVVTARCCYSSVWSSCRNTAVEQSLRGIMHHVSTA